MRIQMKGFAIGLLFTPFLYEVVRLLRSDLGAQPAEELNHAFGTIGLFLLCLNLYLGLLILWVKPFPSRLRWLLRFRRPLGVGTFIYLILHVGFFVLKVGSIPDAVKETLTHIYLVWGLIAFILLLSLAVTSNDYSLRKLSFKRWKRLHKLVYLAFVLAGLHNILIEKADLIQAGLYFAPLLLLLAVRFYRAEILKTA